MAKCSKVWPEGRCSARCRWADRALLPLADRRCQSCVDREAAEAPDANLVVEDRNDAACKSKSSKKTGDITFHETHFLLFSDVLTGSTANEAADIGRALGVQPDKMQLWNSFLGYLLLSAKAKSGLEADRFPETAKQALQFAELEEHLEELVQLQDLLHAPARTRAREAVSLFNVLEDVTKTRGYASDQRLGRESLLARERLWHVFFFLQISNVYVGDASFIERFILKDGFDGETFSEHVSSWVTHGRDSLVHLTQDRLKYVALTRTEVNCRFNPRDGRRLVGSAAACSIEPDDCDEDQKEIGAAEEDVGVDRAFPAPQLPAGKDRGLPRLAYRSRWLDTMVDLQPTWWAMAGQSAAKLVSLLSELIETPLDAGLGSLNIAAERLIESFIAIPVVGAPNKLKIANPTHERVSKCYRAKFLLSYTFNVLRNACPEKAALVDQLARRYTTYGPAPRLLVKHLTGAKEDDSVLGCVAFCRSLRDALAQRFSLDLELYSLQYAPCLFHRACPLLARARNQQDRHVLQRGISDARQRALDAADLEEALLASKLAYIRARSRLWQEVVPLSVLHRARFFREFDLELACSGVHVEKGIAKFVRDIASKPSDADHHWSRRPVGSVKRPRYASSSMTFRLA